MSSEQKIMQCHLCKEHCPQAEMASKIANGRMFATKELIACQKELEAYRAIGTPKECQAAVEKQIPKKPNKCIGFTESLFVCPTCGRKQPIMYEQHYCKECGQKLDWSGDE